MTREEWLVHVVEFLDSELFCGDLDLLNHKFQIACGRCSGKKITECIQPSDNEDIGLDDFFPTTIHVNFTVKDPKEMIGNLALECINAFFNIKGRGSKKFKSLANKYYFNTPYTSYNPSDVLKNIIDNIYTKLINKYGEFPGKPISFSKKDIEKKKTSFTVMCPECGYELKITKKMYHEHSGGLPVCPCGVRMIIDGAEETEENQD